ncbi:M56 family metallopeptidase [Spirosoma harenae]
MNTFTYLLTVSLYLLLFYGCYALLFRRNTFFGLNRMYLVGSVLLSLLLPFVELPQETTQLLSIDAITLPTFVVGGATAENNSWSLSQWFWLAYALGILIMSIRLVVNLRGVLLCIRRGTAEKRSSYTLIRLPDNSTPSFSFGKYMVLNQADVLTEPDALVRHEEAHIRQRHTADILFLEFVQLIFWFNPVVLFYKRALQEVHEFLADRAVLKTPQPDYPHQLVAYALNVSPSALITPFVSKSTLKQRIIMLQKPASRPRALFGYALVLPLAACLIMCTQSEKDQPQTSAQRTPVVGEVYTVVEHQPEFPGGMVKLGEYLGQNLKYPETAQKANVEGKVFVSFIVTTKGEIADVQLLKGIGGGCDEEAIRVVKAMPRWLPGRQSGEIVNVKYNLPIRFVMEEDTKESNSQRIPPPPPPVPASEKSAFFSIPTDDAEILSSFKHFFVDGKEVAFNEFIKHNKANIVEASDSDQSIRMKTN